MNHAQFRWLLIALAGVLVGYVVVRRRRQLVEALPEPLVEQAERFVIPWPSVEQAAHDALGDVKAAVEAGTDAVAQAADKAKDVAGQRMTQAKDAAAQAVEKARDVAAQTAEKARDITAQAIDSARNTAAQPAETAQDSTPEAADQARAAADATVAEEQDEAESTDSSRRKVSATHRISYAGKRYGPLPDSLVGEYVEIENSDGKLNVLHEGKTIASFDL